jgi:hypothetical protein
LFPMKEEELLTESPPNTLNLRRTPLEEPLIWQAYLNKFFILFERFCELINISNTN